MSSETVGIVLAAINGLGIAIGGIITVWRSVATTNVRTLEQRLDDVEKDLAIEYEFSTAMARWGHAAMLQAAAQGITLPDIPTRRSREA